MKHKNWKLLFRKKKVTKKIQSVPDLEKKAMDMLKKSQKNSHKLQSDMGTSIQTQTLQKNLETISFGIRQIQQSEQEAHKKRQENQDKLIAIKHSVHSQFHMPDKKK